MARSQNSFIKKQKEQKKKKKAQEKFERKLEKKNQEKKGGLDDMIAYVDEFGNITSEPPEEKDNKESKDNKQSSNNEKGNS